MKIGISHLGAINEGHIDLSKRFNLLCGPNGTGKTYFAFVIYGLLRTRLHVKGEADFADKLIEDRRFKVRIDERFLNKYRETMKDSLIKNLDELFGLGKSDCDRLFEGFNLSFEDSDESFFQKICADEIDVYDNINGIKVRIQKHANSDELDLSIESETIPANAIMGLRLMLQTALYYNLVLFPIKNVAMFPVERNSIYTFSKELSIRKQEAMDNIQMMVDKERKFDKFDILFSNNKRYPLPVRDGLLIADDLVETKKNRSEFYEFAELIEAELLNGRVQISNDGDIQFKPNKSPKKVLPIQMSASIIKTMSSLVIYLKHIAKKNDLIIIDEPEINLHPDNQITLTRILARLMNNGFRLLISTHSDYIIREINNLVMLSHINNRGVQSLAEENGYTSDMFIDKNDIAVSYFNYRGKTVRAVDVQNLQIDDNGFEVKSIDDVINSQTELSERIYYTLNYSENAN